MRINSDVLVSVVAALIEKEFKRETYVLSEALGYDTTKGIALCYLALESADERVRDAASEKARDYLGSGFFHNEIWNGWIEALVLRHKHYPGEEEMRNDPIVMAIEKRSMTNAYDIRRKIVERAAQMRRERAKPPNE